MLKNKKKLTVITEYFEQNEKVEEIFAYEQLENNMGFKYREKGNEVEVRFDAEMKILDIKKMGRTTFECVHKVGEVTKFDLDLIENGQSFYIESMIETLEIVYNASEIVVQYIINGERVKTTYRF